jgi:flagellar motor protein MotB
MNIYRDILDIFSLRKNCVIFFVIFLTTGCSTVPDALNPVEWFKGARNVIIGDKVQDEKKLGKSEKTLDSAAEDNGFAKLSSVPARPKVLSQKDQKTITEGLVADRDASRKYSNEIFQRKNKKSNSARNTDTIVEPKTVPKIKKELTKSSVKTEPLTLPKQKSSLSNPYLVPPKPIDLRSLQSNAKLKIRKRKPRVSTKTRLSKSTKLKKLPSYNPNPPRIGLVPGLDLALDRSETIVISGSGVEIMNSTDDSGRTTYQLPPSNIVSSSLNTVGNFEKNNRQRSYQVATILFKNGSASVGRLDRRVLRQVVAQHKKTGGRLRIIGHASRRTATNDPIIHKMTNFQISAARAERVAKELVKMGIRSDKLFVSSVSDREPRYYEYMPSGEAGNRRAEIYIDFL